MLAYHDNPKIKQKYLCRVRAHQKADEIINGQYWEDGKGCAVGCTLHSDSHADYETELGIPRILARLEDRLFEAIYEFDPVRAKKWPALFLSSIHPGADLSMVWPKFAHWLLLDAEKGVIRFAKTNRSKAAIANVAELYQQWIAGNKPSELKWRADAAAADADAAAADADAAYAAAADDAAYAARSKHYGVMADKLIELLRAA